MIVVGIDPGKNGAIVAIGNSGKPFYSAVIPLIGNEVDVHELSSLILELFESSKAISEDVHFYVEDVHAIYGSAAGATFSFGFVCGIIHGVLCSHKIPFTKVPPKKWQASIYQGIPEIRKAPITIKKGKRAGQMTKGKLDTKKMSEIAAKRLFPSFCLKKTERCKVSHDGIVDAILIAEYGRRCNPR